MKKIYHNLEFASLLFLLVLLLIMPGCSQTTPNNFGPIEFIGLDSEHFDAKLNGVPWFPDVVLMGHPMGLSFGPFIKTKDCHYFKLSIDRYDPPRSGLTIDIDSLCGLGIYILGDTSTASWALFIMGTSTVSRYYYTDKNHGGIVEIKSIDTLNRLIDGTVSFEAAAGDSVIQMREGTFKARY